MKNELFHKTAGWMKRNTRPLEYARWAYLFEGGSKEKVIDNLSAFQNSDGGFAHGLEPDSMLPESNAIDTWAACQILMEVDAYGDDPIVRAAMDYLMQSYDRGNALWKTVVPEHNNYPHAPWWHYSEDAQENWMYNPTVELASYLIHWCEADSEAYELGLEVMERATIHLLNSSEMDFHEVNNFQKAYEITGDAPKEVRVKLNELIEDSMDTDPKSWGKSYKPLSLNMIFSKEDELYGKYEDLIEKNVRYLKETVNSEGVWDITWEWGQYMEDYYVARQQWKGILAVGNYKNLKKFD
ncbi:hypothetical protein [Lacicoccus qingdaonensis]|uniref:Prenyltransferase and squalene oxidase repeat-containing protein n=1 Tax=Lacicoccus qingdaonensis TaxID=576118 RepID=A0A1G9EI28_9BACL|nr:hypothetical protein [Salinicoccus qingdaonensis]SDK75800.1 hypothetical protein SAMN05216216_1094 [Salinicoccus qingdaonensis]